jgi:MtN3 and saliva related transmembrane protein
MQTMCRGVQQYGCRVIMMDLTGYIGIFAGICTSISLLPQLVKIIKEKKADDISYLMLFVLLTGLASWVVYGFLKEDYPIIITNCFSFLVNILVIIFTIKYKNS